MLSVLPSAITSSNVGGGGGGAVGGARVTLDQSNSRLYDFGLKVNPNFPAFGLCSPMGRNNGAIIQSPPSIMPPLTTACTTTTTPPSPQLFPSPYSPAAAAVTIGPGGSGVPYYAQSSANSVSVPSSSAPISAPLPPSPHYYFPFTHPNSFSRQYIQIDPNYSPMTLSAGLQNPSAMAVAAAQMRSFPRTAPVFTVSPGNPSSTSPSSTPYNVFSFPPPHPHHVSLHPHPPIPLYDGEHSSLPLFSGASNLHSPVRLSASISPDNRSPSSISPHSNISHHSSSPGIVSNGGKSVSFEAFSSSSPSSTSNIRSGGGGGEKLLTKNRAQIRSSEHLKHHHHRSAGNSVSFAAANGSTSHLTSNSILNNANLEHVVSKLRSTTPKRQKSSSSSTSSSTVSCSSRPSSQSQPPSLSVPQATCQSKHFNVQLITDHSVPPCGKNGAKLMYPAHFNKGSIIQLTNGSLKCVEDLSTDDFVKSAEESGNLQIDSSTVVRIDVGNNSEKNGPMVILSFAVGVHKLQVSVEATLEHPFFVFGKGWSSCSPSRTLQHYSLQCHQLIVGDVCISLTHKQNCQRNKISSVGQNISSSAADLSRKLLPNANLITVPRTRPGSGKGCKRKRRFSESDVGDYCSIPSPAGVNNNNDVQRSVNQICK